MFSFRLISIVQTSIKKILVIILLTNAMIRSIGQQRKLSSEINVMYAIETVIIHQNSTMMLLVVK